MAFPTMTARAPRRTLAPVALTLVAFVALVSGCSDGTDRESADERASTTVSPTTAAGSGSAVGGTDAAGDGAESTTMVADDPTPTTTASSRKSASTTALLPAGTVVPADPPTNSRGIDVVLDETALLACAQNQIAWVALKEDRPGEASDALGIAAQRAEDSSVAEISSQAGTLRAAADNSTPDADVDRFLELCVSRGFEY